MNSEQAVVPNIWSTCSDVIKSKIADRIQRQF